MAITAPTEIGEVLSVTTRNESVSRKRKATPSPELSSPRKCLILSPSGVVASGSTIIRLGDVPLFAPSRRLFPSGEAIIANRSPAETMHAQPNSPESSTPAFQFPFPATSFFHSISVRIGTLARILNYYSNFFPKPRRCLLMAISWCFGSAPYRQSPGLLRLPVSSPTSRLIQMTKVQLRQSNARANRVFA
ncbi:hypothetical protein I7I52_11840 [Histoplasma capsulatum]|uniref:Uncharacterized protein n=1 Tax=Ajellomyces capsulatus TaxID=5037 RepID=A0A8H8CSQ6_AJECA|nr:hypothetical protein I7I52_11840 [Histoplasma capsulatum]